MFRPRLRMIADELRAYVTMERIEELACELYSMRRARTWEAGAELRRRQLGNARHAVLQEIAAEEREPVPAVG